MDFDQAEEAGVGGAVEGVENAGCKKVLRGRLGRLYPAMLPEPAWRRRAMARRSLEVKARLRSAGTAWKRRWQSAQR